MCRLQGPDGQWWWHFDYRTGRVARGLSRCMPYIRTRWRQWRCSPSPQAANINFDEAIARGLEVAVSAPGTEGRIADRSRRGLIWRKVARREPAKLSRYVQAGASRVSPNLRAPA